MSTAPVCQVISTQVEEKPIPKLKASIPLAFDLASAINAINAIAKTLNKQPVTAGSSADLRFAETRRVTQIVRVFNPQDSSQYVDVEQITNLQLTDKVSGDVWQWKR